jgi:ribonuclease P protein subunit RPR2
MYLYPEYLSSLYRVQQSQCNVLPPPIITLPIPIQLHPTPSLSFPKLKYKMPKKPNNQNTSTHRSTVPAAQSVPNRDVIQRLSYSYQASAFIASIASTSGIKNTPTSLHQDQNQPQSQNQPQNQNRQTRRRDRRVTTVNTHDIGRRWAQEIKNAAKKATVRLDPSIKRTLCKTCSSILMPGYNVSIRIKPSKSHKHHVRYTCNTCTTHLRIPAPRINHPAASTIEHAQDQNRITKHPQPLFARPNAGHVVFSGDVPILGHEHHPSPGAAADAAAVGEQHDPGHGVFAV